MIETIKFDVAVSVNVDLSQNTKEFIASLFQGIALQPKPRPAVEKPVEQKPVATSKAEEKPATENVVSIEDVRAVLATKVNEHRTAIKEKLTELGAPSVTKLDPTKYKEMFDFLSSL